MTSYQVRSSATTGGSAAEPANPFTLDEAGVRCPYAHYEAARAEGPVVWSPELDAWLITGFDDIEQVLRQPGLASSRSPTGPHVPEQISTSVARLRAAGTLPERVERFLANPPDPTVFTIDPPDHTRQRRTVQRMFTPADVARWEPWAREIATDAVVDMVAAGEVDVAAGFAHRLALGLTARVVGLEITDRERMQRWSNEIVGVIGNAGATDDEVLAMLASRDEMGEVFADLLAERRAEPTDDLTSAVAFVATEEAPIEGVTLSESERIGLLINFHVAGTESTAKLLVNAVDVLSQRPDLWAALRADRGLIVPFVEEVLRLEPPSQGMYRRLNHDMTISGQTIPAGDHVYLVFAAGNRDAEAFPAPAELRLDRSNGARHLSFGRGIHLCLGAPVARMEARVALECLIDGVGSVEPLPECPRRYLRSYLLHGLTELWVHVSPLAARAGPA